MHKSSIGNYGCVTLRIRVNIVFVLMEHYGTIEEEEKHNFREIKGEFVDFLIKK